MAAEAQTSNANGASSSATTAEEDNHRKMNSDWQKALEMDDTAFGSFYKELKSIEERDSVLTPKQQIDRLNRPGATYSNLNPFDVLQIDHDTPLNDIKQKFRRLSILVHPDKNPDDKERSQRAFDAVSKAWKILQNEEGYKRCREIVEEAQHKVDETLEKKRKDYKKKGLDKIPEDDPEGYKKAVATQICKLFADLERLRQQHDMREAADKKRKIEGEEEAREKAELEAEFKKNYEESRDSRVQSWQNFQSNKKAKVSGFKPPKTKMERR